MVAKLLLDHGADIEGDNSLGATPSATVLRWWSFCSIGERGAMSRTTTENSARYRQGAQMHRHRQAAWPDKKRVRDLVRM